MILSDHRIKELVRQGLLLEGHDPSGIKYCGYELRLGKVIAPKTGKMQWVEATNKSQTAKPRSATRCFVIEPSETLVLLTMESLKLPKQLCATYGQLNRLAKRGLMILNTSIVEPGYEGPLNCVLVNFSSQRYALSPGEPIAKINFHQVDGDPDQLQKAVNLDAYEQDAVKNATILPKSLLDISGVEKRVTENVGAKVRRSLWVGGGVIFILLVWSQLEGVFSNWLWQHTGLRSTTKQVELMLKDEDVKNKAETQELKQKINELETEIKRLPSTRRGIGEPAR